MHQTTKFSNLGQTVVNRALDVRQTRKLLYQKDTIRNNELTNDELQVIADRVRDVEYLAVIVSTQLHLQHIARYNSIMGTTSSIYINEEILGYEELDDIMKIKFVEKKR